MSKQVAIAGGSSNVAQEVIPAILARGVYSIVLLSRKDAPPANSDPRTSWKKVDYTSLDSLASALSGIDALLSFLGGPDNDENFEVQKTLIQAAIKAGVRRFAPSEWVVRSNSGFPHYAYKDTTASYLAELNREKSVIEYTLFQPGFFVDYFAHPYSPAKHLHTFTMFVDMEHRRAIVPDDEAALDAPVTLTTVEDMAKIVALALEYEGKWPVMGGMRGTQGTIRELLEIAERIRGPIAITRLPPAELVKGEVNASWYPRVEHPSLPEMYREAFSKGFLGQYFRGLEDGALAVGDEWNRALPEFRFEGAKEFLRRVWEGR